MQGHGWKIDPEGQRLRLAPKKFKPDGRTVALRRGDGARPDAFEGIRHVRRSGQSEGNPEKGWKHQVSAESNHGGASGHTHRTDQSVARHILCVSQPAFAGSSARQDGGSSQLGFAAFEQLADELGHDAIGGLARGQARAESRRSQMLGG